MRVWVNTLIIEKGFWWKNVELEVKPERLRQLVAQIKAGLGLEVQR